MLTRYGRIRHDREGADIVGLVFRWSRKQGSLWRKNRQQSDDKKNPNTKYHSGNQGSYKWIFQLAASWVWPDGSGSRANDTRAPGKVWERTHPTDTDPWTLHPHWIRRSNLPSGKLEKSQNHLLLIQNILLDLAGTQLVIYICLSLLNVNCYGRQPLILGLLRFGVKKMKSPAVRERPGAWGPLCCPGAHSCLSAQGFCVWIMKFQCDKYHLKKY